MEKALKHLSEQIAIFRKTDAMDGEGLVNCLQQITATLFYLEGERAKYHDTFQQTINRLVLEGNSVARAENEAHKLIPEMYMLRRILDSAYECVGAIRTMISYLKQEKFNAEKSN